MAVPSRGIPAASNKDANIEEMLSFDVKESPPAIDIIDNIERRRVRVRTSDRVDPVASDEDDFYMPIDRGVRINSTRLVIPHTMPVCVRNSWGVMVAELTNGDNRNFPEDRYSIDLHAPIKIYINVRSSLKISSDSAKVEIEFPTETSLAIGARSQHDKPAASITVSEDPYDMMEAISYFGSALKTKSCERSYPTLRGHPPIVKSGDSLEIPTILSKPDVGVNLEIPPEYSHIFVASPLAYYLGADIVPSDSPRLTTQSGFSYPLSTQEHGFETHIERVLKQSFFFDCLVRTEGFYQVNLHERNQIEPYVDIDFSSLYDATISEQLETYLSVPFELIKPELPKWKLTSHIVPEPKYLEHLPFLVNDLSIIKTAKGKNVTPADVHATALENFMRGNTLTRSATRSSSPQDDAVPQSLVQPEQTGSLEQVWVGPDVPVGSSKGMVEAFENRLEREPTTGDIDLTVVCNDRAMDNEGIVVNEVYGSRHELSFDVEIYNQLSTEELENVLQQDTDFLHYIGHIDERGFECIDGMLDVSKMNSVGVDSFFLNACTSYQQGKHLIELGSVAGVVTLNEVVNSGAELVGKSLAKLLNQGFTIRAGLSIAKLQSIMGNQYIVLGDGNADIAQPVSGTALLLDLERQSDDFKLRIETFPTSDRNIGSIFIPYLEGCDEYYLCSGPIGPFNVSRQDLANYLEKENFPIKQGRSIVWTEEIEFSELVS